MEGHSSRSEKGLGYLKADSTFNVPRQTFRLINKGDLETRKAFSTVLGRKFVLRE
jgi:hypothetical protein